MPERDGERDRIISEILGVSEVEIAPARVGDATTLRGDLGLKSLQAVTLALNLEEIFDIVVEEERLADVGTVGDVIRLVESLLEEKRRGTAG